MTALSRFSSIRLCEHVRFRRSPFCKSAFSPYGSIHPCADGLPHLLPAHRPGLHFLPNSTPLYADAPQFHPDYRLVPSLPHRYPYGCVRDSPPGRRPVLFLPDSSRRYVCALPAPAANIPACLRCHNRMYCENVPPALTLLP